MCMLTLPKLLSQDMLQMNCFLHLPKLLDFVHAAVSRLLWMLVEGTDLCTMVLKSIMVLLG
jgi:hypothetical protein